MYEPSKQYQYLNNVYVFFVVVVIVGYVSVCWLLPLPCVLRAIWSRTLSIRWNRTVLLHCWRIYVSTMQFGLRRTTQFDNDTTVCAYFFFSFLARMGMCVCACRARNFISSFNGIGKWEYIYMHMLYEWKNESTISMSLAYYILSHTHAHTHTQSQSHVNHKHAYTQFYYG